MAVEIERRFLCRSVAPEVLERADRRHAILQGYLTADAPAVRIRRKDDDWILTVKTGRGLVRREVEIAVGAAEGGELLEMAGTRRLEKDRYVVGRWEIDVYAGTLDGLVVTEVELRDENEPMPAPPDGVELGREVTDDGTFTGQRLAALDADEARRLVRAARRA